MTDADAAPCRVGVVIVAAGSGTRLGAEVPKAFVELDGHLLLEYALDGLLAAHGSVSEIVVVAPDGWQAMAQQALDLAANCPCTERTSVVVGGAERTDSVRAGIEALDPACDVILIHDAARCLTPPRVFERVVDAVLNGAAGAVPGLPVVDTIKSVDADGVITGTPDRAMLRAVQTPQGFDAKVLRAAYAGGLSATDDAALVEATGHHVRVVEGDPLAFKVTTPEDLAYARRILAAGWTP